MSSVSVRDLRNHMREILRRVERGEPVQITVDERLVAELRPFVGPSSWVSGPAMEAVICSSAADGGLWDELRPLREQFIEWP